jgi:hypothetical protein
MADYFTRLSAAMSAGEEVNRILVLEPTTNAWMYQTDEQADKQKLDEIGASFQRLVTDQPMTVYHELEPGENTIEVVVIGTLKNTLGPHHAGVQRGAA